jgi:ATP-dependent Clp protease ATP-binding subunit ClpC
MQSVNPAHFRCWEGLGTVSSSPEISEQEIRERCAKWLRDAGEEASRLRHNFIGAEHLFIALTYAENGITQRLLNLAGIDPRAVRHEIRREVGVQDSESPTPGAALPFTPRAHRILADAVHIADDAIEEYVGEAHLLLALLREGQAIPVRRLRQMGANIDGWIDTVSEEISNLPYSGHDYGDAESVAVVMPSQSSTERHAVPSPPQTPLLDRYGRDLTALAREGKLGPAIGREREIRAVARTLTRNKKNNPLLVGDAGVGKTAVVEGLAYSIVQGAVPSNLANRRVVQLEIGTLVAGTSLRGQFEERLVGILEEARSVPGIILFIDEIHTIVGAGDTIESNLDAANILKPALSRGEIVCIGATTHEEYRAAIAKDAALERRFRVIEIGEPSVADTLAILNAVQGQYAAHHGVTILPEALQAAVTLSAKYMHNRRQPDKALDLLDEACARVVIQTNADFTPDAAGSPRTVTPEAVAEVLAEWTGIPVTQLTEDERRKYSNLEDALRSRVIGQDHAVHTVAAAIRAHRAGLADPSRPVGVFLFLGPSGVGKTELAKAIAAFLFGSEEALVRLDMSEFHDEHTVARLIGSPPGYKDSQRGGQLTEALRRRPYSVILLDEVEKAAPEVFDIFLQVFDDGRLTDARGGTVDARHAVWIMTSNIGTGEAAKGALGFRPEDTTANAPNYMAALRRFFRPELLNRLDDVLVFNPLSKPVLTDILNLQLREIHGRLAAQGFTLQLTPQAVDMILTQGYDPVNGARPLRRAIERLLTRPLSQYLLETGCPPGAQITVDAGTGGLTFCVTPPPDESERRMRKKNTL